MTIDVEQRLRRAATVLDEHLTAHAVSSDPMEVNVIIERSATPRSRRVLLGVCALAVVAAVIAIVAIATGGDGDKLQAPTDNATTTTTAALDQTIANAILLPMSDYSADWLTLNGPKITMNLTIASAVPACAPYRHVVFESPDRPASVAYRWFNPTKSTVQSGAAAMEYVVVLADETAAKAMFDAMQEPSFNDGCLPGYLQDPRFSTVPGDFPLRPSTAELPDLVLAGDQYTMRSYDDNATPVIGPVRFLSAIVRVGRTITVIETITNDSAGREVMPLDHFQTIVTNVVSRARTALGT